ncbi:hypothetical protein PVAP13_7NG078034 [Panicum virgatum]|uniref:Uncharacterized protein n=1 Tax=Panicum virgatum TaxID=38727 RepID=A0A8T0Q2X7_PANVG|nr:hypothetical protein PVAP13_7NG078034 [Panicum virgatum]KAG2564655.1 hypothetical protein PVAP13_7NG078034 [Panicum virgatum]
MEEFVAFCKSKKAEQARKCSQHPKINLHNSPLADKNRFKDRVVALYGDYLPIEVNSFYSIFLKFLLHVYVVYVFSFLTTLIECISCLVVPVSFNTSFSSYYYSV